MVKNMLRNFGIAAVITTGALFGVNKCEQNIIEKSGLLINVAEKMTLMGDSWKNVYTKLGKGQEYSIKCSNGCKNPIGGLSKEDMKQYLKLPSTVFL